MPNNEYEVTVKAKLDQESVKELKSLSTPTGGKASAIKNKDTSQRVEEEYQRRRSNLKSSMVKDIVTDDSQILEALKKRSATDAEITVILKEQKLRQREAEKIAEEILSSPDIVRNLQAEAARYATGKIK